ncbi:FAD-dependent oxidoreductase [Eggerthella guodeyinii]|uniref:FAD-dependent oxidoreductase n=2 Tax=Eggerthella TaxID=84111 RepID=A0A6L7IU68_9ACTN|nr:MULTISPECIES: FAD-dependent oxidoreductase [Eggerthella]MBC5585098.1 FAD-dependent oxidoreductase [Eggerthella hominis]QOS69160.1 FAD-dependent oxidoreductase [Eggerthella guodeyinii]
MSMSTGISRRSLLKGAALSAAGVAALGVMGCSPQASGASDDAAASGAATEGAKHTWEVKPDPIAADKIKETVDTDVLVIGGGYSGTCCALSAAENGAKVILVEKDAMLNGHGVGGTGAIGSRELDKLDISFDKSIEMERWVSTCGNRCRESLVAKWFRESERCMNWFLDLAESNGATCMVTVGSRSTVHPEIDCYHMIMGGDIFEQHTMADFVEYLFESEALKNGAQFVYEMPAVQLVQDDSGKVTGAVCENKDGEYVQYNASKGVVLATGDVSYNDEYLEEFAPIAFKVMTRLCSDQGNVGDGHNMAAWAGGAFQAAPWPTMMHPQAAAAFHGPFLFVNPAGKRFMNEATWVQGKCVGVMVNGGSDHAWSVFDANWQTDLLDSLQYGGGMFWDSFRAYGTDYQTAVDSHAQTVETGLEKTPAYYKRADTLEELAEQLDVDKDEFLATVEQYNKRCEAGEDTDFYKESHFLYPIKEGPFTACMVAPGLLGVCGGVHISDEFEVLNDADEPIEGLYAIGNCAGDIYAYDYPINVQGNSHGRCLVEGKCLGEQLAGVYDQVKA